MQHPEQALKADYRLHQGPGQMGSRKQFSYHEFKRFY